MRRFLAVVFWSVIAAAFIGPGTVTTAAAAGAGYRYQLIWALVFSTLACLVLQEAAARLTVISGRNLGQALRHTYRSGFGATAVLLIVLGAIVLGCAAYEAGNILGGVAGLALASGLPPRMLALACGLVTALLLWRNRPRTVANILSLFVAIMGVAFLATAIGLAPPLGEVLRGSLVPALPTGGEVLVLGLVGTTVVPYNLFLGSGIAAGQSLSELRFGLAVAVLLGGLISIGVLITGVGVSGGFSFEALAAVLGSRLGGWAARLAALGLFAAGLSSAITAPLAAAVTARSLFASGADDRRWAERSWRYRMVWLGVLGTGLGFGLSDVRPVPAIVLAQAFNGVLLPLVAIFLFLAVNDRRIVGEAGLNGAWSNGAMLAVLMVTLVLGTSNVARALATTLAVEIPPASLLTGSLLASVLVTLPVIGWVARRRRGGERS